MNGKLIIVSGYSGSGKSTLIAGAIEQLEDIEYLRTVTTRPRREGESDTIEYDFVTDQEYDARRKLARMWDHVEYQSYKYGVDIDWVLGKLEAGTDLICAIAPDTSIYEKLKKLYRGDPITIWIDVDKDVSDERIRSDTLRSSRDESDELRSRFQYTFAPKGRIEEVVDSFSTFLKDLR